METIEKTEIPLFKCGEIYGWWVKCLPAGPRFTCEQCALHNDRACGRAQCVGKRRKDGKSVYFVRARRPGNEKE